MIVILTTLAFALRFYKINYPDQVVYVPYPCPRCAFLDMYDVSQL